MRHTFANGPAQLTSRIAYMPSEAERERERERDSHVNEMAGHRHLCLFTLKLCNIIDLI